MPSWCSAFNAELLVASLGDFPKFLIHVGYCYLPRINTRSVQSIEPLYFLELSFSEYLPQTNCFFAQLFLSVYLGPLEFNELIVEPLRSSAQA